MDRRAIIEHLEDLRAHCQSMVDTNDPASIWWGDTEALDEAIKALSLNHCSTRRNDEGNYRRYGYLFHRIQGGGVFER